jgi:hypothetical protein
MEQLGTYRNNGEEQKKSSRLGTIKREQLVAQ